MLAPVRRAGAALGVTVALGAGAAHADPLSEQPPRVVLEDRTPPPRDPWTARPLSLSAVVSAGGPYGAAGVAAGYAFSAGLSLELGAGIGAATRSPQGGGMLRLRLPIGDRVAVGSEGGLSVGAFQGKEECPGPACRVWHWDAAVWGNLGLSVSARFWPPWTLRVSAGAASIFNTVDGTCSGCAAGAPPVLGTTTIPYVTLAAGWTVAP